MGNLKISFPCVIFIHFHSIFNFCDCRTEGTLVPSTCCTSHPCNLDTMTGPATCQPATESCRVFSQFLGVSYLQPRRRHMGLNCKVPPCSPCTEHRCPPPAEAAMLSLDLSQHVGMSCHGSHHPPQVHWASNTISRCRALQNQAITLWSKSIDGSTKYPHLVTQRSTPWCSCRAQHCRLFSSCSSCILYTWHRHRLLLPIGMA